MIFIARSSYLVDGARECDLCLFAEESSESGDQKCLTCDRNCTEFHVISVCPPYNRRAIVHMRSNLAIAMRFTQFRMFVHVHVLHVPDWHPDWNSVLRTSKPDSGCLNLNGRSVCKCRAQALSPPDSVTELQFGRFPFYIILYTTHSHHVKRLLITL